MWLFCPKPDRVTNPHCVSHRHTSLTVAAVVLLGTQRISFCFIFAEQSLPSLWSLLNLALAMLGLTAIVQTPDFKQTKRK